MEERLDEINKTFFQTLQNMKLQNMKRSRNYKCRFLVFNGEEFKLLKVGGKTEEECFTHLLSDMHHDNDKRADNDWDPNKKLEELTELTYRTEQLEFQDKSDKLIESNNALFSSIRFPNDNRSEIMSKILKMTESSKEDFKGIQGNIFELDNGVSTSSADSWKKKKYSLGTVYDNYNRKIKKDDIFDSDNYENCGGGIILYIGDVSFYFFVTGKFAIVQGTEVASFIGRYYYEESGSLPIKTIKKNICGKNINNDNFTKLDTSISPLSRDWENYEIHQWCVSLFKFYGDRAFIHTSVFYENELFYVTHDRLAAASLMSIYDENDQQIVIPFMYFNGKISDSFGLKLRNNLCILIIPKYVDMSSNPIIQEAKKLRIELNYFNPGEDLVDLYEELLYDSDNQSNEIVVEPLEDVYSQPESVSEFGTPNFSQTFESQGSQTFEKSYGKHGMDKNLSKNRNKPYGGKSKSKKLKKNSKSKRTNKKIKLKKNRKSKRINKKIKSKNNRKYKRTNKKIKSKNNRKSKRSNRN